MSVGPLSERVQAVCDRFLPRLGGSAAADVAAVRAALGEPLRVAVAGRVNAGKSTLVNALIGKRVAPTDETECTRVVTWFRYGQPERVEIVFRDGSAPRDLRLRPDGLLPTELGVDSARVRALNVWLSVETLRAVTLVDTPGLQSLTHTYSQASTDLLEADSQEAAAGAHALAFLINQTVKDDDLDAIRTFRAMAAGTSHSSINAIAVLNKADLVGGDDPWKAATDLAARHAETLRGEVSTVLPLVGLVAETSVTGHLSESDVAHLETLAALGPDARLDLLFSVSGFVTHESDVPPEARERLLRLLGLYGLGRAFELIDAGCRGATRLRPELRRISGLPVVADALLGGFRRRGDALKTDHALRTLERMGYGASRSDVLDELRGAVEEVRDDPTMHPLREMAAEQLVLSGGVTLPEAFLADFERMISGGEPAARLGVEGAGRAELAEAARAGVSRWKTYAHGAASPRQKHIAEVMDRSYFLLWKIVSS